jgi:hypothetical protein
MTASTRLTRWGILATGRIAGLFAEDIRTVEGAELTAVASRSMERACAFLAEKVSVPYPGHGLAPQAAEVMRCLREGLIESPLVPLSATLAVLRTLDEVRGQVGVRYPESHGPSAVRL